MSECVRKPLDVERVPRRVCGAVFLVAALCAMGARRVHAMIDPSFTPVHLVEQSERIFTGKLMEAAQQGDWDVFGGRVLKGPKNGGLRFSLGPMRATVTKDARDFLHRSLDAEAVCFLNGDKGYLLVGNVWMILKRTDGDAWQLTGFDDQRMLKTYTGAADMLRRMTEYILRHDDADVPVEVGVTWRARVRVGTVKGEVKELAWIPPTGEDASGRLFVASTAGERLFAYDARTRHFADVTTADAATLHRAAGMRDLSRIAADFDGDGYADVLHLREEGSLLSRGKAGGFEAPRPCAVTTGGSPARWCVGDFDADGRLDLYLSGTKTNQLWENDGAGGFRPVIHYAGSLDFTNEPGAADVLATDLNHDGRTDLIVLSAKGRFVYHFNRGFRCFAAEGELTLDGGTPRLSRPVRATAGDFNTDGSLDLAVAFDTGEVFCFLNERSRQPGLWICLPTGHTGPVTVSVWQGAAHPFCVGTHLVTGHAPATYVPLRTPGPCTLRWRTPEGERQTTLAEPGKAPYTLED